MPCHRAMSHDTPIAILAETITVRVHWLKLSKSLRLSAVVPHRRIACLMHRAPSEDLPQSTRQRKVYCRVRALDKSSTDRSCGTFSHAQRPCSILSLAHHHTGMVAQHRAKSTRGTAYLHQRCLSYLAGGAVFHDGLVMCGISAA